MISLFSTLCAILMPYFSISQASFRDSLTVNVSVFLIPWELGGSVNVDCLGSLRTALRNTALYGTDNLIPNYLPCRGKFTPGSTFKAFTFSLLVTGKKLCTSME